MAAISSRKSGKAAAAALAVLLALLAAGAGPAAGATSTRDGCFVGWSGLSLSGVLSFISCLLPNPFPSPKPAPAGPGLTVGYYAKSCPSAEELVRKAVESATSGQYRGLAAGLIRLHFHDAFVRGCDASVLLDKTATGNSDTEKTGPPNQNSLRGFEVIDAAKKAVEEACPNVVSCADILAFAARDASKVLSDGRIYYEVPAGRYDGRESFAKETDQLPGPDSDVQQLKASFAAQGLSLRDVVTLSGAHSVGVARCLFFADRLKAMDPAYAKYLSDTCTAGGGSGTRVNQDYKTPDVLDNQYYKNMDKFVLFASDAALNSSETIEQVMDNARDGSSWEKAFGEAMVKMGKIVVPGYPVEIRKVCSQINQTPSPPGY